MKIPHIVKEEECSLTNLCALVVKDHGISFSLSLLVMDLATVY